MFPAQILAPLTRHHRLVQKKTQLKDSFYTSKSRIMLFKNTIALTTIITTAALGLAYLWYQSRKDEREIPTKWTHVGYIEKIAIYPIKSCAYKELSEADCTELGPKEVQNDPNTFVFRDRAFLVYDTKEKKVLRLYKRTKAMSITVKSVDEDTLILQAPDVEDFILKLSTATAQPEPIKVGRYGFPLEAIDCGDAVAEWLTKYLKYEQEPASYRLGYFLENFTQQANVVDILKHDSLVQYLKVHKHIRPDDGGLYAWYTSYMVINKASVDELNRNLPEADQASYLNFRPNLMISGTRPFEEDKWKWIKIGDDIVMKYFLPCQRCSVTTINPDTGERNKHYQPLKFLRSTRQLKTIKEYGIKSDKPAFGVHMGLYSKGRVRIGDPVYASF